MTEKEIACVIPSGSVAVMVPVCKVVTTWVVAVNVAVEDPLGTVTLAGTATPVWLLVSVIVIPPAGALALRVTVPVAVVPPTTVAGFNVTLARSTGWRVREVPIDVPDEVAFTSTAVDLDTPFVEQVNVALSEPAAMFTDAGMVTRVEALLSAILTPAAASPLSDTVPVEVPPPARVDGLKAKLARAGGITLSLVF